METFPQGQHRPTTDQVSAMQTQSYSSVCYWESKSTQMDWLQNISPGEKHTSGLRMQDYGGQIKTWQQSTNLLDWLLHIPIWRSYIDDYNQLYIMEKTPRQPINITIKTGPTLWVGLRGPTISYLLAVHVKSLNIDNLFDRDPFPDKDTSISDKSSE